MKRLALITVLCLLTGTSVYAGEFAETKALAEQGLADSQFKLGLKYDKGEGVPQDYAEAAKWFHKAAEQGYAKAQFNLGIMYYKGLGVPQDHSEAYVWSSLAAADGNESAAKLRDVFARKLSAEELASAQKRATRLFEEIQQTK